MYYSFYTTKTDFKKDKVIKKTESDLNVKINLDKSRLVGMSALESKSTHHSCNRMRLCEVFYEKIDEKATVRNEVKYYN